MIREQLQRQQGQIDFDKLGKHTVANPSNR